MGENAEKKTAKSNAKKVIDIVVQVILYVFFALCVFALIVSVFAKKDDGAATVFGHQIRIVTTGSMDKSEYTDVSAYKIKSLPVNTMVFIEVVPEDDDKAEEWYGNLKAGDVLTFKFYYDTQRTITHRIVEIEKNAGAGYTITLAGDNKSESGGGDTQVIDTSLRASSPNYVIGKVVGKSVVMGNIAHALQTPVGLVLIVIVPCAIILILQVLRIVSAVTADRKEKETKEKQEKDDEIEALKKQLAELSETVKGNSPSSDSSSDKKEE